MKVFRLTRRPEFIKVAGAAIEVCLRDSIITFGGIVGGCAIALPCVFRSGDIPRIRYDDSVTLSGVIVGPWENLI